MMLPAILLFLLGWLPFAIPYQYRPNPVFPSEAAAFILALLFTLSAVIRRPHPIRLPATQVYWLLAALFIGVQLVLQTTLYYEFKLIPLLFMLSAAAMSYALTLFKKELGLPLLTDWFLLGLVLGGLFNSIIAFGQVYHSITSGSAQLVYGGIGQRNMYGNYLMGGFVAFLYLASKYRLRWWLTVIPLLWLVVSLAWAGSRAILLYLTVLFFLSIWMYWRKPLLRDFCRLLIIGLILAAVAQFFAPYLTDLIGWITGAEGTVPTAIDRLTENGARRLVEWQKAWLIFTENKWLGAGWGGFAANSLRLHTQPAFYRVVESALFTHAHNGILHILAENGIIGSLIILGGLVYLVLNFCFRINSPEKLALALVLLITTLHSLVEYPLWYFHFFAIFVVCLGLLVKKQWYLSSGAVIRSSLAVYSVLALTCTGWGGFAYYQLSRWQQPGNARENRPRLEALAAFQHNPLVDFHAAITASGYIDANHDTPLEVLPLLTRLNQSRPYPAQLIDEAILQARTHHFTAAHYLVNLATYGYPDYLPSLEKNMTESPHPEVKQLMPGVRKAKQVFSTTQ